MHNAMLPARMTPREALEFMRRAPARNRVQLRGLEFCYELGFVSARPKGPDFSEPRVGETMDPERFLAVHEKRGSRFERSRNES